MIDFGNSNPNNAATVGDLQNLGWIVSAEGNNYSDQVRNANEVKFVGEGTATVSGKTDDNGVRTITVKVDDQAAANNAVSPVVYTDEMVIVYILLVKKIHKVTQSSRKIQMVLAIL